MLQFLRQMFHLFVLLRDDPLKPATPLTNGAIDKTLQQFAPLSDDCLLQLVGCRESSTSIDHLLKGTPRPKQRNQLDSSPGCLEAKIVRLDERDVLMPQVRRCVPGSV